VAFPKPADPYALPPFAGRFVTIDTDESQDVKDRYGRLLACLDTNDDATDVGRAIVAAGWAHAHVYKKKYQRLTRYKTSQAEARAADIGAWKLCGGDFHSEQ
jgi:endonuclease YncB( thermonuclease family)